MHRAYPKTPLPIPLQQETLHHMKTSSTDSPYDDDSSPDPPLLKTKSNIDKSIRSLLPPISPKNYRKATTLQIEIPQRILKQPAKPNPSPATENNKITRSKITMIDDFGLLNYEDLDSDAQTYHPYTTRRRSVVISDFWGKKTTQEVLQSPELKDAVRYMKHKRFVDDLTLRSTIASNSSPRHMDENINLKLIALNAKSPSTPTLSPFSVKTPEFVIKNDYDMKRSKELKMINEIMKDCDELHMDIQTLSEDRRKSLPVLPHKLTAGEKKRIRINKKLLW